MTSAEKAYKPFDLSARFEYMPGFLCIISLRTGYGTGELHSAGVVSSINEFEIKYLQPIRHQNRQMVQSGHAHHRAVLPEPGYGHAGDSAA